MTVKQLFDELLLLIVNGSSDMPVEATNSYWRNEGYGEEADDLATSPIQYVIVRDGVLCIETWSKCETGDEPYPEE